MRCRRKNGVLVLALVCVLGTGCQILQPGRDTPKGQLVTCLKSVYDTVTPPKQKAGQTFEARFKIIEGDAVSSELSGHEVDLAIRAPDRLYAAATIGSKTFRLGRDGQEFWIYAAEKKFAVIGRPGVPRFKAEPGNLDNTHLGPLRLPFPRWELGFVANFVEVEREPDAFVGTNDCLVLNVRPRPHAVKAHHLPASELRLWVRRGDHLPVRISYADARGRHFTIEAERLGFEANPGESRWTFSPAEGDRAQTVALSHLMTFLSVGFSLLNEKIPTLGPATGERRVLARSGQGRLEDIDGTTVLFVKGSPEEMGRQHGALLRKKVQRDANNILYGVGIASSLANGTWFFGEMEDAQQRLLPYMDARYLREMDSLAAAARRPRQEIRMANLFPELFHCSGFAIFGDATVGGTLYHGRVLDYFRGAGLERNAVVMVVQPDAGNTWVNISYAGFIGSVTAMNEKGVAIGEMGGRGEGHWDGKPMAELVREVMEKADTIDQALDIMRRTPRTCEYYYVVSDGKTRRAVAIHATPAEFETAWAGEKHPLLPEAVKDAVFVSGGDRLKELISRIKAGYGKFDAASARDLMARPVCMPSNLHSVLFAPETLDFWVANADSKNVASATRYTHYNLRELLVAPPVRQAPIWRR